MTRSTSRRRRGGGHADGHSGGSERWLVSYADLITLLFAFFVVMFAISQSDVKKFREVSEAMRRAFSANAPAQPSRPEIPGFPGTGERGEPGAMGVPGNAIRPGGFIPSQATRSDPELELIRRLLEQVSELDATSTKIEISPSGEVRWVVLDSYAEGSGRAAEDFWPLLRRIAGVLARFPERRIRWEGHADPNEAEGDPRSLALVSMDRAQWMDQFMKREWKAIGGGATRRRSAEVGGFGISKVLGADDSRWSRARNRRVELVILPRFGAQTEK